KELLGAAGRPRGKVGDSPQLLVAVEFQQLAKGLLQGGKCLSKFHKPFLVWFHNDPATILRVPYTSYHLLAFQPIKQGRDRRGGQASVRCNFTGCEGATLTQQRERFFFRCSQPHTLGHAGVEENGQRTALTTRGKHCFNELFPGQLVT